MMVSGEERFGEGSVVVAEAACRPRRRIGPPFIGHKSNNAMPYDTRADTELRQNDTNAWNPAPFPFFNPLSLIPILGTCLEDLLDSFSIPRVPRVRL